MIASFTHLRQVRRSASYATCLIIAASWFIAPQTAVGHAVYMTYVRHDVNVMVTPQNIDFTVELTFHEVSSLTERQRMDRDRDGAITAGEISDYLADLTDEFDRNIQLKIDDKPLELIALYDPQIDLLGTDGIEPTHHVLRLFYFARTPASLTAGSRITLTETFWPNVPALRSTQATGRDGITAVADDDAVRCLAVSDSADRSESATAGVGGEMQMVVYVPMPMTWRVAIVGAAIVLGGIGLYALLRKKQEVDRWDH